MQRKSCEHKTENQSLRAVETPGTFLAPETPRGVSKGRNVPALNSRFEVADGHG